MKIQHLIPIFFLAAFCTVSAQTNGAPHAHAPFNINSPSLMEHQKEIFLACATTITNIQLELHGLAQQYAPFSDITSASIQRYYEAPYAVYIRYSKNAHFVLRPEFPETPRAGVDVIDKGGAKITVFIYDVEHLTPPHSLFNEGGQIQGDYPILEGQNEEFRLHYFLSLNTTDPALEKAVNDIIEKQSGILRKTLHGYIVNKAGEANPAVTR